MKKATLFLAFTLLSVVALSIQANGEPNDQNTISEFCRTYNDLGLTHGGCVAFFETNNIVPHDASICRMEEIQTLLGVTNHGQCMKKLREMREDTPADQDAQTDEGLQ